MSRLSQIQWWTVQMEALRERATADGEARHGWRGRGLDDPPRARGGSRPGRTEPPGRDDDRIAGETITGRNDEERQRGVGIGGASGGGSAPRGAASGPAGRAGGAGGGGLGARAGLLAQGYQPAVVKVISYAHGVKRATATGQYVQRDDAVLETHDGRILSDKDGVAEEIKTWSKDFEQRAESQDVVAIRLHLAGLSDTPEGRAAYEAAIASGFAGHRYAYRVDATETGGLEARLVVAMAGENRERLRVKEQRIGTAEQGFNRRVLDTHSEARIKGRIEAATGRPLHAMSVEPGGWSHGREGVTFRLNELVGKGPAVDDRGQVIANANDTRVAAREWGPSLRSQSPRDTMHLMISAKADTDPEALRKAARAFLHAQFGNHKFMFGLHTDKAEDGHIHAHAVIAVKNESGQKIHPGPEDFRAWRESYAEHARAEGMRIVATAARERASSQSYGPKDKAIVEAAERPRPNRDTQDRVYANDPANRRLIDNARRRIETARTNPMRIPVHPPARVAVNQSAATWAVVAQASPQNAYAQNMAFRVGRAAILGSILETMEKRVNLYQKAEETGMAVTAEKMAQDLRAMNEAVMQTALSLEGETKQQFQAASERYLLSMAARLDVQRASERGVTEMDRAQVERLAGVDAERVIARAIEVENVELREAQEAERIARLAAEQERRDEGNASTDPEAQRQVVTDRAVANATRETANREQREAAAAIEAARVIGDHPAQPISQNLVETDALAKLKAEQERLMRELEAEDQVQRQGPTRQK